MTEPASLSRERDLLNGRGPRGPRGSGSGSEGERWRSRCPPALSLAEHDAGNAACRHQRAGLCMAPTARWPRTTTMHAMENTHERLRVPVEFTAQREGLSRVHTPDTTRIDKCRSAHNCGRVPAPSKHSRPPKCRSGWRPLLSPQGRHHRQWLATGTPRHSTRSSAIPARWDVALARVVTSHPNKHVTTSLLEGNKARRVGRTDSGPTVLDGLV
mmetsp:Transcript_30414/g.81798  ORF Transcript_30414/g.81798 Transcript_30414/m.81798 type:complete len:214 (+) Transcript_30414:185-826(+)